MWKQSLFSTFSLLGKVFKEGFSHLKKQITVVAFSFLFSASLALAAEKRDGKKKKVIFKKILAFY